MWTNLAILAALTVAPAQPGDLTLSNVRATYGPLGITRTDTKLLPGDHVFLAFDIEGITVADDGKVQYSITTEILDAKGKVIFRQEPRDQETINALGGNTVPALAQLDVGLDTPPGEYTFRLTVTDRASERSKVLSRPMKVNDPDFGLVRVTTSSDPDGDAVTSLYQAGHSLWVNFGIIGFGRDKLKKQPQINLDLRVLDDKNQPTLSKPFHGEVNKDIPEKAPMVPGQFLVSLNRPGKFTVEIKATDAVTGKMTTLSFPLVVLPVDR